MEKVGKSSDESLLFGMDYNRIEKLLLYGALSASIIHLIFPLAVRLFSPLQYILGTLDYLFAALTVFAAILWIAYEKDEGERKKKLKGYFTKDQILISSVPIILLISVIVAAINGGINEYSNNVGYLFDTFVCTWIIYPVGKYIAGNGIPKAVEMVCHAVLFILTVIMAWILVNVFLGNTLYTAGNGLIGMTGWGSGTAAEYHLQVNAHHNLTGAYSASIMIVCICMALRCRGALKFVYVISAPVHALILILTNSRSTFISSGLFMSVLVALALFIVLKGKIPVRLILAAVAAVIVFIAWCLLRNAVFATYEEMTSFSETMNDMNPEDAARDLDITNLMGRELIWEGSIKGALSDARNILVGVTPHEVCGLVYEYTDGRFNVYTHNQFLEIAVATGVPSLALYTIWLIILAIACIRIGFAKRDCVTVKEKTVPIFVMFLVIFNLAEATLMYYGYFVGVAFMLAAGWCMKKAGRCKTSADCVSR